MGSNDDFYRLASTTNTKRKESEDWDWATDSNTWSDVKTEDRTKKSSTKKQQQPKVSTQNEDLLIDFGAEKKNEVATDGWASWENDAWESLNKKD